MSWEVEPLDLKDGSSLARLLIDPPYYPSKWG